MLNIFSYDAVKNRIVINEAEVFLIKEFADLWDLERNKCDQDPEGFKKLRGFRELVYIYLAIDWRAPGSKDTPSNRHQNAIEASLLTDEEFEDPVFRAACRKYRELQDSSSILGKLVESYTNTIHKIRVFIDSIDYSERSETTGMPIFKVKDTLTEIQNLSKVLDALEQVKLKLKEEQEIANDLRGDQTEGLFD
jgi:hypothetical protein